MSKKTIKQVELELMEAHSQIQTLEHAVKNMEAELAGKRSGEHAPHETYLARVFNVLPVGISILNNERKVVFQNAALSQILHLTPEGLQTGAYKSRRYLAADGSPMPMDGFASAQVEKSGQAVYNVETGVVTEDGETIWINVSALPVDFPDWKTVISTADITERKRLEHDLRESEQKYTLLFQKSTVPTVLLKLPEVTIVDVNEACEKLTGFTRQEMFGKTSVELGLLRKEERKEVINQFERQGALVGNEVALYDKKGAQHLVLINTTPVKIGDQMYAITTMQDITELRHAEAELQISLTKYKTLFETFPLGITVSGSTGNILETNPVAEEMLGLSKEEQAQRQIDGGEWRIIRTDGAPMPVGEYASVRALAEGRKIENVEMGIVKPDANVTWINVTAAPLPLEGYGVVVTYNDVSERKQAEEKLRENEEFLRLAYEAADLGVWKNDLVTGAVYFDDRARAHYGFSQSETTLAEVTNRIHPDDLPRVGAEIAAATAPGGSGKFVTEYRVIHPDGSVHWLDIRVRVMFEGEGEQRRAVVGYGTSMDITQRKQAEETLRQRTEELEQLLDILPEAIWIADDPECKVIHGNHFANELLKVTTEANVSQSSQEAAVKLRQFGHGRELEPNELPMQMAARTGQPQVDYELRIERMDGETRTLLGGAVPLFDSDGKTRGAVAGFHDITERKRTEDELRRSNAELEQFAYIASHDLQEPLRTIAGMVQLLQKRYEGQLDERADEYIGHAVESAARMQALIRDLLSYSRVDRKNQPIVETHAQDCLQIAIKNLGAAIQESRAEITAVDLPTVHADPIQLTQLFQNLIGNSIKFHGEAPPRVQISATQVNGFWQFAVQDNGIGIEPQYFERIFLVFQRLHTRRQYQGTGIGLSLCKKIIERHGGSIWVESQPGTGSTFYFTLPLRSES